ncbi:MFS transporter [Bacillus infantis]|uniref:MFS transporter n=1 Tax=Bacillus infantis TaxID=324767 RepID=UPI003CFAB6B5
MKPGLSVSGALLVISGILVASNIYTLIPIYGEMAASLHADEGAIIAAGSLFSIFYAMGLLTFGPLSDRAGRKKVIVFGMLASALATFAVGLSGSEGSLYILRSLQGFVLGSFAPVAFAYSFDLFSGRGRTLLLVLINTGFLLAGILGQLISSVLTLHYGWQSVFFFFSVCYLTLFILAWILLPATGKPAVRESVYSSFAVLLKNNRLLLCYVIAFTLLFSFAAFYDSLARQYSGTFQELFLLRAAGMAGAILSLFTGRLIEKFGVYRTLITGLWLGILSMGLLLTGAEMLVILSVSFVASISLLIPSIITLIGSLGGERRAKALSLYSFVLLTGASLASPAAAILPFAGVLILLLSCFAIDLVIVHRLENSERDL